MLMILARTAKLAACSLAAVRGMYLAGWLLGGEQTIKRGSEFSVGVHPGAGRWGRSGVSWSQQLLGEGWRFIFHTLLAPEERFNLNCLWRVEIVPRGHALCL